MTGWRDHRAPTVRRAGAALAFLMGGAALAGAGGCGLDGSPGAGGGSSLGAGGAGGAVVPTCWNGVKDDHESDVDCGGVCPPCAEGFACASDDDCESRNCSAWVCIPAPTCNDGVKNGEETDTDCGGETCAPCAEGGACAIGSDCESHLCVANACAAPSCHDGTRNGAETDCDCGGPCVGCPDGGPCQVGTDCESRVCEAGRCAYPECWDGVKNGTESDTDCGGPCSWCHDGQACNDATNCASNVCWGGVCVSCQDGKKNASETDTDCGGLCAACADGKACDVAADCQSHICAAGVCVACDDGVKNGTETDTDCGGVTCSRCADGLACALGSDCASLVCKANTCAAPACDDGVQNGAETDRDCGGPCAPCGGPVHGTEGPSCDGGLDCGGVSCCQSTLVPGGVFRMGRGEIAGDSDYAAGNADEVPEHWVTIADVYLDTFEITVGRFRTFVAQYDGTPPPDGAGAHPLIPGSGWQAAWNASLPATKAILTAVVKCDPVNQTWTDAPGANENLPMSCLSWFEAAAFCAWDGGRLPTEAEWEYAAAGGVENRLYPWGASLPGGLAQVAYACGGDGLKGCATSDITAVGSMPGDVGRWGHRDLGGDMTEWVFDGYAADWCSGGGAQCTDCANLNPASGRVTRGACWNCDAPRLRAAARSGVAPTARSASVGARCARSKP